MPSHCGFPPFNVIPPSHHTWSLDLLSTLYLLLLLLSLTTVELSLGGSSPYTSTDKTNKNKYINETIQKHSTNNIKHRKYNTHQSLLLSD